MNAARIALGAFLLVGSLVPRRARGEEGTRPPVFRVPRLSRKVRIDGKDGEWESVREYALVDAESGKPADVETRVRIAHGEGDLYLFYTCAHSGVASTLDGRDDPLYDEDAVEVFLDPQGRGQFYYEFEFNSRGALLDAVVVNGTADGSWRIDTLKEWQCGGIEVKSSQSGRAGSGDWTCEVRIPLRALVGGPHRPAKSGDVWRFNVYRIFRTGERDAKGRPRRRTFALNPAEDCFHNAGRFAALRFQ